MAQELVNAGNAAFASGNFKEAREKFTAALDLVAEKQKYILISNIGAVLMNEGSTEEAVEQYEKVSDKLTREEKKNAIRDLALEKKLVSLLTSHT